MSHATHFLRRLERVSTPQMDLALALYRDRELILYLLTHVRLPEGAERIALALEERPDGPHVIMSRKGDFITCLGEGMSVGDTPVVPRSQLDHLSQQFNRLREATEDVRERGELKHMFRRIFYAGCNLSREDFLVMSFMYPLMLKDIWKTTGELSDSLIRFRQEFKPRRYRRMSPAAREELKSYWRTVWALGHHLVLHGEHIHLLMDRFAPALEQLDDQNFMGTFSWPATRTMSTAIVLRGAWAVGRSGRRGLPGCKQFFDEAESYAQVMDCTLGLTCIGLRHRRLRAEVLKTLARRNNPILDPESDSLLGQFFRKPATDFVEGCAKIIRDDPKDSNELHRSLGANLIASVSEELSEDNPLRFERPEDVPDELAYTVPLNMEYNLLKESTHLAIMGVMLPWVANCRAEDMYLPAKTLETYQIEWDPQHTLSQLETYRQIYRASKGTRAEHKPGRNEPCICGSGKKYKRCCGAA